MTDSGSGDHKFKFYLAVKELVDSRPLQARLHSATMGIAFLLEHDFPSAIAGRVMTLKNRLVGDYQLLRDNPKPIPDDEAMKLASEFFAIFAIICDPKYF